MILTNAQHLEDDSLITMTEFDGEFSASELSQISQISGVSQISITKIETSSKNLKKKKKKMRKYKKIKKNEMREKMLNSPLYSIYVKPIVNDFVG